MKDYEWEDGRGRERGEGGGDGGNGILRRAKTILKEKSMVVLALQRQGREEEEFTATGTVQDGNFDNTRLAAEISDPLLFYQKRSQQQNYPKSALRPLGDSHR